MDEAKGFHKLVYSLHCAAQGKHHSSCPQGPEMLSQLPELCVWNPALLFCGCSGLLLKRGFYSTGNRICTPNSFIHSSAEHIGVTGPGKPPKTQIRTAQWEKLTTLRRTQNPTVWGNTAMHGSPCNHSGGRAGLWGGEASWRRGCPVQVLMDK